MCRLRSSAHRIRVRGEARRPRRDVAVLAVDQLTEPARELAAVLGAEPRDRDPGKIGALRVRKPDVVPVAKAFAPNSPAMRVIACHGL